MLELRWYKSIDDDGYRLQYRFVDDDDDDDGWIYVPFVLEGLEEDI